MSQSVNKASEQTAAQAVAVVDARKGTIAEQLAARVVVGGSRKGETALVGEVSFTNEKLLPAFMNIARPQVQQFVIGLATRMDGNNSLNVTEDILIDIDEAFIKPHATSSDNDVIGHYAACLLGQRGWGGKDGKQFINGGRWAAFKLTHDLADEFALLTVKKAKRVRS